MKKNILYIFVILLFGIFAFSSNNDSEEVSQALKQFKEFYIQLNINYVDTLKHDKLILKAIDGTIKALDPHSKYYTPKETENRKKSWKGILYGGIGANVKSKDNNVIITYCRKGYGADSVGFLPGDIIKKVNDTLALGLELKEVVNKLRGEKNTTVNVTVQRGREEITKTVIRKQIVNKSITYSNIDSSKIGVIRINQFLDGGGIVFRNIVENFVKNKAKGIIIDIRTNPGGLLKEAVTVISAFLPKGSLVCALKSQDPKSNYSDKTKLEPISTNIPLILLVNKKTISAAEVLSGTLQDYDRAVVIGTQTWGKGLVQGTRYLKDGSSLYITAARYYLPSGRCIQEKDYTNNYIIASSHNVDSVYYTSSGRKMKSGVGIIPDIKVKPTPKNQFIKDLIASNLLNEFSYKFYQEKETIANKITLDKNDKEFILNAVKSNLEKINNRFDKEIIRIEKTTEGYFETEIKAMKKKSLKLKESNFEINKAVIVHEFQRQLIKNLYHNDSLYSFDLKSDIQYLKAVNLIDNKVAYQKILQP